MSLFRRVLGLDLPASADLPVDPDAPLPATPVSETASVRRIAARLGTLPPSRARFVAAFAYLLGRAASADLAVSEVEVVEMTRLVADVGGLDKEIQEVVETVDAKVAKAHVRLRPERRSPPLGDRLACLAGLLAHRCTSSRRG